MATGPVIFLPSNGANINQAAQGVPGTTVVQPPGMVQYVQYGGQQLGILSSPPQQNPQVRPEETFLKAEAKTLGAIQIFIGLMHIGLGSILAVIWGQYYTSIVVLLGYVFWGAIFFIISGSLSVSAEKHLTPGLVKCSVGMNITSAVVTIVGIIVLIIEMAINPVISYPFDSSSFGEYYWAQSVGTGLSALLLLFNVLEFCITVSTAYFGCQSTCCHNDQQPMVYVPYAVNGAMVVPNEGLPSSPPAYSAVNPSPKTE